MKRKLLLFATLFISSLTFSQDPEPECVEIFISEYVEGWSNNKAIELYNPTDQDIDLSNYRLERYSNGDNVADENQKLTLGGVMPPLSVYVIVIDKRDTAGVDQNAPVWEALQAKADTFMCPVYNINNVMYFNGNDALVLRNTSLSPAYVVDRIGKVGEDPGSDGWNDVAPDFTSDSNLEPGWTANHSLIRKSDVLLGDLEAGTTFNVGIEWDSIPPVLYDTTGSVTGGNWASLGSHTCDCGNAVGINEIENTSFKIYPNPTNDYFIIDSETAILNVVIYSMNGVKILDKTINNQEIKINSSDWTKGYYLVNLRLKNGYVFSKKVLIQ
jgi:hypothetical protein